MKPRALFLLNPSSNGGKAALYKSELKLYVSTHFPGSTLITTKPEAAFWNSVDEIVPRYDLIVACGGDGTAHQAGNLAAGHHLPLGVVPLGSGNDFAAMMKIPPGIKSALEQLRNMNTCKIDLIKLEGDLNCWCLNTTGIGLDGLTNHLTEMYKPGWGRLAYGVALIKALRKARPFDITITCDGEHVKTVSRMMVTACNGFREGGAFVVAPQADNRDGKAELLELEPFSTGRVPMLLYRFLSRSAGESPLVSLSQFRKLSISSSAELPVHTDGEYGGKRIKSLTLTVVKHRLRIVC